MFHQRLVGESSHHPAKATVGKTEHPDPQAFPAGPDAPATEHALIGIVGQHWTTIINGELVQNFTKPLRIELNSQVTGYFLKLTSTGSGTLGTLHGMTG